MSKRIGRWRIGKRKTRIEITTSGASSAKSFGIKSNAYSTVSKVISVLMAASQHSTSHLMSHLSMAKLIKKRCERCEEQFDIPLLKQGSRAFKMVIDYTPCPHCRFVKDIHYPKYDKSGRCRRCSVPFAMVDHKAKGHCHRCLMARYRELECSTK